MSFVPVDGYHGNSCSSRSLKMWWWVTGYLIAPVSMCLGMMWVPSSPHKLVGLRAGFNTYLCM